MRVRSYIKAVIAILVAMGINLAPGSLSATQPDEKSAQAAESADISQKHLNIAYETIFITRTTRAYNEIIPNLARRIKARMGQQFPDIRPDIDKAVDEAALAIADGQGELDLLIARDWAERFSIEELREISAFYASPTGVKLAKSNTQLIANGLDIAQAWGQKMGTEMVRVVREKLRKQGHNL